MALVDDFIANLQRIAADNNFRYYNAAQGESNGLGAVTIPYTLDCATFCAYCLYLAEGWTWYDQPHGYFWPYITQTDYDDFLINEIGCQKLTFTESLTLLPGDIIMCSETLHHNLQYIGNGQIIDANNYFGYGDNSIAVRTYPTYATSNFVYVYRLPDQPSPTVPGRYVPYYRHQRRVR